MERPRTGHRPEQAGTITVGDLIRREHRPVRIPSADEQATTEFVHELLGPPEHAAEPRSGRLGKAAKLVGLVLGAMVLCASVATASVLTHQRRTVPPAALPVATQITGAGALRADPLASTSGRPGSTHGSGGDRTTGTTGTTGATATGTTGTTNSTGGTTTTTTTTDGSTTAAASNAPVVPASATPVQVVRTFYELVSTRPDEAARLVLPSLLAEDPIGIIQSWSNLQQIQVESVTQNPDGTVQAVIRTQQPDGTWQRVVELLHVTSGNPPLISGAEVLSVQRG